MQSAERPSKPFVTPANIPQALFSVREIGIDFGCGTVLPIISGNTIVGALVGLGDVPNGSSLPKHAGTFINVPMSNSSVSS